ncbi:MAG: ABC transporter permease subunit [Candidatus Hadarchaeum sp.]|uniref:ABC transporter permease subunit n=1 Tax=Candidatus Hadarchaeum sp. TaxID=2883567 RepID=UPI0031766BD8
MMIEKPLFKNKVFPFLLIAPQIILAIIFFIWPAVESLYQSLLRTDPFGLKTSFVGISNFKVLFADARYIRAFRFSFELALIVTAATLALGMLFAVVGYKRVRGSKAFSTLIIAPYALAPAIAAVLWLFAFQPQIGIITRWLKLQGITWNYAINAVQAKFLICLVTIWQRLPYNFIFFTAALASIPKELWEAAYIDGANEWYAFWCITFPLISPTTFFLLVTNITYALFDTFGIIDALTNGGPAGATTTLCFKTYLDGFVYLRLAQSAAQSVILLSIGVILSALQFKFVQRRVQYAQL